MDTMTNPQQQPEPKMWHVNYNLDIIECDLIKTHPNNQNSVVETKQEFIIAANNRLFNTRLEAQQFVMHQLTLQYQNLARKTEELTKKMLEPQPD